MTAVPADTAVTTPDEFTVATPGALLLHPPPAVAFDNVVEPGLQMVVVPVIGFTAGDAFTTCVIGAEVLVEKFAGLPGV